MSRYSRGPRGPRWTKEGSVCYAWAGERFVGGVGRRARSSGLFLFVRVFWGAIGQFCNLFLSCQSHRGISDALLLVCSHGLWFTWFDPFHDV